MNRPSPGLAATLSHPMGEGLGVRALFQWKFMAPIRLHQQMEATHEPTLR